MRNTFLFILLLVSSIAFSSEVVIQGSAEGFDKKDLRAYVYDDYITFKELKIANTKINDGRFKIAFELDEVKEIILKIEDKSTVLFAEPGKVYNIHLSYNEELNRTKIYDKYLSINFSFPQPTDLNQLISSFNKEYDKFFQKNYNKFLTKNSADAVKEFYEKTKTKEKYQQNDFIKNYIKYVIAGLLDISGENREKLKSEYLNSQTILYTNKEYFNFFKQFFQERFRQFAISKTGSEMLKAIMFEEDLPKTLSIIQKGENLSSPELAELYLLNGLYEDYYIKTVNQESNKKMLEQIAEKGKTAENRKIAKNIQSKLGAFDKGAKAPAFTLKDKSGKTVSLKDFVGKYVYLNFWSSWSIPSLQELKVMQTIYSKYKDKVEFVSINVDDDVSKMKNYLNKENYPWPMLHYGNDYEIMEKYQVRTIPTYLLIDREGNLMEAPAEGPLPFEEKLFKLK